MVWDRSTRQCVIGSSWTNSVSDLKRYYEQNCAWTWKLDMLRLGFKSKLIPLIEVAFYTPNF